MNCRCMQQNLDREILLDLFSSNDILLIRGHCRFLGTRSGLDFSSECLENDDVNNYSHRRFMETDTVYI